MRKPECELDLIYLIGKYWGAIKEKTELEDITFVDKHWDAIGIYRGRDVTIEVKVNGKNFDKDPNKIDLLICWRSEIGTMVTELLFPPESKKWELNDEAETLLQHLRSQLDMSQDYQSLFSSPKISSNKTRTIKSLKQLENIGSKEEIVKKVLRCVGIEVIELSKILI